MQLTQELNDEQFVHPTAQITQIPLLKKYPVLHALHVALEQFAQLIGQQYP